MSRRGPYAKGVAKREEILHRALEVIAREGYRGASVKELAAEVGLSQAGLLHYFGSKEQLFTEILRTRDRVDEAVMPVDGLQDLAEVGRVFTAVVGHNSELAGIVELFSRLSVDAAAPDHPAHSYFLERGARLRGSLEAAISRGQESGAVRDDFDAATLARIVQATADGLQLQWLQDPSVDMAAATGLLFDLLRPDSAGRVDPR